MGKGEGKGSRAELLHERPDHTTGRAWFSLGGPSVGVLLPASLLPTAARLWESSVAAKNLGDSGKISNIEMMGAFLDAILTAPTEDDGDLTLNSISTQDKGFLLSEVYPQFAHLFKNDIHVASKDSPNEVRLIRDFIAAQEALHLTPEPAEEADSALIKAAEQGLVGFFVEFNGQAFSYFSELRAVWDAYPSVHNFIRVLAEAVMEQAESSEAKCLALHTQGLDVLQWIMDESKCPSPAYLCSAPISYPLIAMTQLAHYFVILKLLKLPPQKMLSLVKAASGHSQGVTVATVIASSRTEEDFISRSIDLVKYLFWQGARMQQVFPYAASTALGTASNDQPTPMLAVLKLTQSVLQKYVEQANKRLSESQQIYIGLCNGPRSFIVCGPPLSLERLLDILKADQATGDQSRVPFSKRRLEFTSEYLPCTVAFHCEHMRDAVPLIKSDVVRLGISIAPSDLLIPVYSTEDGRDLRAVPDVLDELIRLQCTAVNDWTKALAAVSSENGITHVLDFGPGEGSMTARLKQGLGVQVISCTSFRTNRPNILDKSVLLDHRPSSVTLSPHWGKQYGPRLVRLSNGTVMLDTKFTRALGKPPVMMAGMTPCTVDEGIVSACLNAGYHGELAGGGQHTPAIFRDRLDKLRALIRPGDGITVNLLFLNPYLWGFEYPMIEVALRDGDPIDGITIAAGVPTLEKSTEIITKLGELGMQHIAYKPGSIQSIHDVVAIAKANPQMNVILQWTGGRAGGHHSFEDVYEPVLQTYPVMRSASNIILVAGSGIGDGASAWPWLSGEWSCQFGFAPMPFDGVLLGSRLCAAKEMTKPDATKERIAKAAGIENQADWEKSYDGEAGGVVTVLSELGEPIHKLATRGVLLWREFDKRYFTKPPADAEKAIAADKDYIIKRINADFQKVYFGKKADGRVADLPEMTYGEIVQRMTELMYIKGSPVVDRWIDVTFRDRVYDFLLRIEERFCRTKGVSILKGPTDLEKNPYEAIETFFSKYAEAKDHLVCTEDIDHFLAICLKPGKPVNFIPVIDNALKLWFKRDSLFYAEDLEAVPDQDVDRTCILNGPVAVHFTSRANEPVADILSSINRHLIESTRSALGAASDSDVPEVEYLGGAPVVDVATPPHVRVTSLGGVTSYELPEDPALLPDSSTWLQLLAGTGYSWLRALLTSPRIVQGYKKIPNYVAKLVKPRAGAKFEVSRTVDGKYASVRVFWKNAIHLQIQLQDATTIELVVNHVRSSDSGAAVVSPLVLLFKYNPATGYAPIHEVMDGRNARVKQFYAKVWFGASTMPPMSARDLFTSEHTIQRAVVEKFCRSIGYTPSTDASGRLRCPLDYAIVACWESLIKPVFADDINGDLLRLVHLSNKFKVLSASGFHSGDLVRTHMRITDAVNSTEPTGKLVSCHGTLNVVSDSGSETPVVEVWSQFLIRSRFDDYESTFRIVKDRRTVAVADAKALAVLQAKPWIHWELDADVKVGDKLVFSVETSDAFGADKSLRSTKTSGTVTLNERPVATVDFEAKNVKANVAVAYLMRHGVPVDSAIFFEEGGYNMLPEPVPIGAPSDNNVYADASADYNPIHVSPFLADLAGLPDTIVHGMWTSAQGRRVIEQNVCKGNASRIVSYNAEFRGMVLPRDNLFAQVRHVGMRNGLMILELTISNEAGAAALKATAEVEQPKTAYVFTGQGSAQMGMGMDLYASSPVAKQIWDRADAYFRDCLGISILELVRSNPKELTVYFGGAKGEMIRREYMALKNDVFVHENGVEVRKVQRLFPEVEEETESFTYLHPEGLLFATQFTQPAIILVQMAAYNDMKSKGLIPKDAVFAGHSLGEYGGLCAVAEACKLEQVLRIVFLRGMTMQNAVQRDSLGRSPYAMAAVNPKRVGPRATEKQLLQLVDYICQTTGKLLQVVNFNIKDQQYVVSGELTNLECLSRVLNALREDPRRMASIDKVVEKALEETAEKVAETADGFITLERGVATIPLAGIDVPFHSRVLRRGVDCFREVLRGDFEGVMAEKLIGMYVPNLIAKPFRLDKEYAQEILDQTESPVIAELLPKWDAEMAKGRDQVARLVMIELLAYQFASPVRWIETQDFFFGTCGVERLVEIGPAMTLIGMAKATLAQEAYAAKPRLLFFNTDTQALYYKHSDSDSAAGAVPAKGSAPAPAPSAGAAPSPPAAAPPPAKVASAPASAASPAASSGPIADSPVTALEVLRAMIAVKLKKSIGEVGPDKSIKELVGGKSAIQNEILGDLEKEFGAGPDNAAEITLEALATHMGATYKKLGKLSSAMVNKMVSSKMPGGFGMADVKGFLQAERLLAEGRIEGVLAHALTMEPAGRLEAEGDAKAFLNRATDSYAAMMGISIPKASESGGGGAVGGGAMVDSRELLAMKKEQEMFVREQIRVLKAYIGDNAVELSRKTAEQLTELVKTAEAQLAMVTNEFGKVCVEGVKPMFDLKQERKYHSFWAWSRQDVIRLYNDLLLGTLTPDHPSVASRVDTIINRACPEVLDMAEFYSKSKGPAGVPPPRIAAAHSIFSSLATTLRQTLRKPPSYKERSVPMAPFLEILPTGTVSYKEVPRSGVETWSQYVDEMRHGSMIDAYKVGLPTDTGKVRRPFVLLKRGEPGRDKHYDEDATDKFLKTMKKVAENGISFSGKTVLVTGCGKGSIALELVKAVIAGGGRAIATLFVDPRTDHGLYRELYEQWGSKGSELVVIPFNGASAQDVTSLVNYIYDKENGLGVDVDYVIPFAALPEQGRDIGNIDSLSELSHRIMLTNVLRLLGAVKNAKASRKIETRPAQCILPMSPNHGLFGFDGLYAESKIGLETLFNKWSAEGWGNYLSITGAVIGWTRGTNLMATNNLVAPAFEKAGARTFSPVDTAFNILALTHPDMCRMAQKEPVWAELGGGFTLLDNLNQFMTSLREGIIEEAAIKRAIVAEAAVDEEVATGSVRKEQGAVPLKPRAKLQVQFPRLPSKERLERLSNLRGAVDLEKVAVITGFSEIGPWGNARTRWEMESYGEFSLEGCVELAWIMGLIKYFSGRTKAGQQYVGWVDAATQEPVADWDVKAKYEQTIVQHTGVRMVEPALFGGYNPNKKKFYAQLAIDSDMHPFEVGSKDDADHFKRLHGDKCDVYQNATGGWLVALKKGATLLIPKALRFDRLVAGQIPTGWNPANYGVPKDIIDQVDPCTLYAIVTTVDALYTSGVTDPYEFYEYVHVSEVGNTSGGGLGGARALQQVFFERKVEGKVQSDILQETFINTMPAWVNMLLLSSSGPIKTPVGACATAAESVEIGVDTLMSGKAKVVIVGAYDDFSEEGSYEFAQMKATSSGEEELAKGRKPSEMSRPTTTTRSGFMEAQGCGLQILMTADLAVRMGCPIYGVVAYTATATDKEGRSVPAPGQGVLTAARENKSDPEKAKAIAELLLDVDYRKEQLESVKASAQAWKEQQLSSLQKQAEAVLARDGTEAADRYMSARAAVINEEARRMDKNAYDVWGQGFFRNNTSVAPIKGALAVYGLTPDDISMCSLHGTSTKANDKNETEVLHRQLLHIGRTPGNPVPIVCQKWLTGHPKGPAAAWMINGLLQAMMTGTIPGNRNADDVSTDLRPWTNLVVIDHSLKVPLVNAALVTSFGFGQAGAEVVMVHPDYLLATLSPPELESYVAKRAAREQRTFRHVQDVMCGRKNFVQVKTEAPYSDKDQHRVYLDPCARAHFDKTKNTWVFGNGHNLAKIVIPGTKTSTAPQHESSKAAQAQPQTAPVSAARRLEVTMREVAEGLRRACDKGIGIDIEPISTFDGDKAEFIARNFTDAEVSYCESACPSGRAARYAGRWAAKEAVIKAISTSAPDSRHLWKSAEAPVKEIEVLPSESGSGVPIVRLSGYAKDVAATVGVQEVVVTISHAGEYAIAQANAR